MDGQAISIAVESDQALPMTSIETDDRVVKPSLGIDSGSRGKWIVDERRPSLFVKSSQYKLLVFGWHFELLD
jgi:hypothetical protein